MEEVSVEVNIIYRYEYYKSTTQGGYTSSMFFKYAADGVFTSLPIKFIIKT